MQKIYRKQPHLQKYSHAGELKYLQSLELPTSLVILVECQMQDIKDIDFPDVVWYRASIRLRALDLHDGKCYASVQGTNPCAVYLPESEKASQTRAIETLADSLVPLFLQEMKAVYEH